ncbi:mismatch repair protein 5 [Nannizzia gypsea CBS 118893]|uniref:DNA mismatch repair protein MSH5 n=1 Tax=Arthroderma gypseum (strain ATCC MYA-4604 / CBS 118893) TaxID=535722 RepID=E4UTI5_ARTGP|nr:mismatch repair protein 5 [Nannizzia gypsea CBS 118893]EFR01530.1 mismatch repair protein 5 [Nannizzia gypsea CBS 118893]
MARSFTARQRRNPFAKGRGRGYFARRSRGNAASSQNTQCISSRPTYSRATSVATSRNAQNESLPSNALPQSEITAREERLEDDDEEPCKVVMAIDMKDRGMIGCSYYSALEEKLYVMEDIVHGEPDVIDILKLEIEPTVLLISLRADQVLEDPTNAGNASRATSDVDSHLQLPYQLDVRPTQEFGFESAKIKLSSLKLSPEPNTAFRFLIPGTSFSHDGDVTGETIDFTEQQGYLLNISGVIDMENCISVGCAGAILTYLQRKRATISLRYGSLSSAAIGIKSLGMISLQKTMLINKDTLASLQILQSESHPNAFNQGPGKTSSGSKEALSIYGLFHHFARTPQGKRLLKQCFLRPSIDPSTISQRHEFINVFLRPENNSPLNQLIKSLKNIKNLRPVMIHLRKGISTGSAKFRGFKGVVWSSLLDFAFHAIDVNQALQEVTGVQTLDVCSKALLKLDLAQLHQIGSKIHEIVDLSLSIEERRTVVRPGIDQDLDKLKETYSGMDDLLNQVAINIATSLPEGINKEINVVYFPQLGFNIAMPFDDRGRPMYGSNDEDWTQVFNTENRAYFKDSRMREMDEKLGDIYGLICEKEIEIVYQLAQDILTYEHMLVEASDICGEIDSLLALVQGASLHKLVRPRMTDENIISIKGGRHMLHEATVSSFVPNNTFIVGGKGAAENTPDDIPSNAEPVPTRGTTQGPSMLLLTGPNFSGKSVYLSQAAIIVYMAHIGSFVPADSALIGYTDRILTRVSTRETVSKVQSTFANDLQQVSFALSQATHRSLIIIDEFGKGTESSDGAGLACGLFEYVLSLGDRRPKVIAATHFHEIFENGFLKPRPELEFGHMEVQVNSSAQHVEDQIIYLYNFRLGRSSSSFGTNCAAMAGIDPAIISRAQGIERLLHRKEDLVAICARMTAREVGELERAERLARRFLEADFSNTHSGEEEPTNRVRSLLEEMIGSEVDEVSHTIESEENMENSPTPTAHSPSLLSP